MKNLFKNFGYVVATGMIAFAIMVYQPGEGGPVKQAQATGGCAGASLDLDFDELHWNADDLEIDYDLEIFYDLGEATEGTIDIYRVDDQEQLVTPKLHSITLDSSDPTEGEESVSATNLGVNNTADLILQRYKIFLSRPGCTDVEHMEAFVKPSASQAPVVVRALNEKAIEDGDDDDLWFDFEYIVDDDIYGPLTIDLKYSSDTTPDWENITEEANFGGPQALSSGGEDLIRARAESLHITVDDIDDSLHQVQVIISEYGTVKETFVVDDF